MAKKWDICMQRQAHFDWLAVGIVIFIAAFFALTARFNSQPSPSFVPAAVLSATGCGLLVTAWRKMRGRPGIGLVEAGLGGLALAFFQFAVSLTYPGIATILVTVPTGSQAFLLTWGLIGFFAVALSMVGAVLGHLIFAPLRPLPIKAKEQIDANEIDGEEASESDESSAGPQLVEEVEDNVAQNRESTLSEIDRDEENGESEVSETSADEEDNVEHESNDAQEDEVEIHASKPRKPHLLINYAIGVLLIGLLPMVVGYVFAAAYDFAMDTINIQQLFPGLYPTLSLLSGLLPWRLAAQIDLANANGLFIIFTLLWRIPDNVLGNPSPFDVQALEPLFLNAAALAILLFTMYGREHHDSQPQAAPWNVFIGFEALLGLTIILPSNFWLLRGLVGILQFQGQVIPLPPLRLLNNMTFILNVVTGVVFSVLVGLILRRQYQLWTQPRPITLEEEDDDEEEEDGEKTPSSDDEEVLEEHHVL